MTEAQTAAAVRMVGEGQSLRRVAAVLGVNPVTVGRAAKRAGIVYPTAQKSADARRGAVLRQPEQAFQAQVIELAGYCGWLHYHTYRSTHSPAGFPDLVLLKAGTDGRPGRLLFAELKAENGRTTPAQEDWLARLRTVPNAEVFLWKPSDWPEIARVLA